MNWKLVEAFCNGIQIPWCGRGCVWLFLSITLNHITTFRSDDASILSAAYLSLMMSLCPWRSLPQRWMPATNTTSPIRKWLEANSVAPHLPNLGITSMPERHTTKKMTTPRSFRHFRLPRQKHTLPLTADCDCQREAIILSLDDTASVGGELWLLVCSTVGYLVD